MNNRKDIPGMFEGPMLPLIINLSMPIFSGMFFQLLYSLADTYWLAAIDKEDPSILGGTGIVFPMIFFAIAVSNGFLTGTSSLVARAIGRRDSTVLSQAVGSGLALAAGMSIILTAAGYLFSEEILTKLGAEGSILANAREYFVYILPGMSIMLFVNVFFGILQGEGLMSKVMTGMLISTVINIVLDPIMIFYYDMGIKGAALATVYSQVFALIYVTWIFVRNKTSVPITWSLDAVSPPVIADILVVGFPLTLAQSILSVSFFVFNRIVISIDPLALTSFTLCGRIDHIVFMPIFATSSALITIIGQNYGRGSLERVRLAWRTGVKAALAMVFAGATIVVIFAPKIYNRFTDNAVVLDYAVRQARVIEYSYLFAVIGILGRSVFQALGRSWPALVISGMRLILLGIPLVLLFVKVLDLGIPGVWYGLVSANFITVIIVFSWVELYLSGLIKNKS